MSKLNFQQAGERPRNVDRLPGWVLMLVADVLVAGLGLVMLAPKA
jgi:hypothetical protein